MDPETNKSNEIKDQSPLPFNEEEFINREWEDALKVLAEYIMIPNQSPAFDPEVLTNGLMEKAINLLFEWVKESNLKGMKCRVIQDEGYTPLMVIEVDAFNPNQNTPKHVLMYGHMDKQPPLTKDWNKEKGLGPYTPVFMDDKLYGRGGADDGYSIFASIISLKLCQMKGLPHPKITIVIEGSEESGSTDLVYYMQKLKPELGKLDLVVCLDSGCANYDQVWITNSLRGCLTIKLQVQVLKNGVHSGDGSGIIPSPFRIMRMLLNRIENCETGIMCNDMNVIIPQQYIDMALDTAKTLGDEVYTKFPMLDGMDVLDSDSFQKFKVGLKSREQVISEFILNRTWRPALSYIGFDGIPHLEDGGNVVYPSCAMLLSIRLPPTLPPAKAIDILRNKLTTNIPYSARVNFDCSLEDSCEGWESPPMSDRLRGIVEEEGYRVFKKPVRFLGEGGSIPFMKMLSDQFPNSEFIVTGILGPNSNAHGPDEFLHIQMVKKLTSFIGGVLSRL